VCGGDYTTTDTPHSTNLPSLNARGKMVSGPPPRSKVLLIHIGWEILLIVNTNIETREDKSWDASLAKVALDLC
jgi:hypothetical protein